MSLACNSSTLFAHQPETLKTTQKFKQLKLKSRVIKDTSAYLPVLWRGHADSVSYLF